MGRIIIAGDLLPSKNNVSLFENGNALALFGEKVLQLFKDADYSIINLEGPLTEATIQQDKVKPVLKSSKQSIRGIKSLGVTSVALANNHITDYLQQGYYDTVSTLDSNKIRYLGVGSNESEIKKHESVFVEKKKVCIYNVSETFFNLPGKNSAGVNLYDEYVVCNDIKKLKETHDYLIVLYHGGAERCAYPTPMVRKRFHRMADSGADFITAQHTHCIGCEEHYKHSYLLFGQGNFLFDRMSIPMARQGLVTEIDVVENDFIIKHHLVKVTKQGTIEYDDKQDLSDFYKRSKEIIDEELAKKRYEDYILNNLKLKEDYILSYQGESLYKKFMIHLFPKYYKKNIEKKYTKEQLLRILLSLQSDRTGENVLTMWRELFDNQYL